MEDHEEEMRLRLDNIHKTYLRCVEKAKNAYYATELTKLHNIRTCKIQQIEDIEKINYEGTLRRRYSDSY